MTTIFKGFEVEGSERGEITIFIPHNAENRKEFLNLALKHNISRLYFGAGNDRGIAKDVIPLLKEIPSYFTILLEIVDLDQLAYIPESFLIRTNVIFVLIKDTENLVNTFKIETKSDVHWYNLTMPVITDINDNLYKKDIVI